METDFFFFYRRARKCTSAYFPLSGADRRRGLPLHRQKRGGALCEQESAAESRM